MSAAQAIVFIEMLAFFGGILAFCWWQVRLMRRDLAASEEAKKEQA
ncbi:MAG: hypothetical protein AAGE80_07075 [Pseudomonadota bacterium]